MVIVFQKLQAANAIEDVVCAVTSSDAVFKLFNVESDAAVVVLKKFDDLRWDENDKDADGFLTVCKNI